MSDLPTLVNCQARHTAPFPCPFPYPSLRLIFFLPWCSLRYPYSLSIACVSSPFPIPQILLGDMGERCKLPYRVRAEPGRQRHFGATKVKTEHMALG